MHVSQTFLSGGTLKYDCLMACLSQLVLLSQKGMLYNADDDRCMGHWWNDNWLGKSEMPGQGRAPVPLCPTQMAHGPPWG
jgi:hypothetical protein